MGEYDDEEFKLVFWMSLQFVFDVKWSKFWDVIELLEVMD